MPENNLTDILPDDDLDRISRSEKDRRDAWCYGFLMGGLLSSVMHIVVYYFMELASIS